MFSALISSIRDAALQAQQHEPTNIENGTLFRYKSALYRFDE
jgi:hypothetical protein